MTTIRTYAPSRLMRCLFLMMLISGTPVGAVSSGSLSAWTVEQGAEQPSYAVVEPLATDLNIDTVVLACEQAWGGSRILQLQLSLTDDGPLQPKHPRSRHLRTPPRAEVSIDQKTFPVALLFADDYVVLADGQDGPFPLLSEQFLDAMQSGMTMTLRFDVLDEGPDEPPSFDSEAVIDLQALGGQEVIASMRRCAEDLRVNTSLVSP